MELEYRFAAADDIENLVQIRLDMLRVVNDLGADYVFDDDFVRSSREYFLNGDQITVLAAHGAKIVGCASICFIEIMPTFAHPTGKRAHLMNVYTDAVNNDAAIAFYQVNGYASEPYQNPQDPACVKYRTVIFSKSLTSRPLELWNNRSIHLTEQIAKQEGNCDDQKYHI